MSDKNVQCDECQFYGFYMRHPYCMKETKMIQHFGLEGHPWIEVFVDADTRNPNNDCADFEQATFARKWDRIYRT